MSAEATIYVVDDDAAVRSAIVAAGQLLGHRVVGCASALEFLEAHDGEGPSCLVLDIRMPGMSGIELQKRLAGEGVTLPIVVVSGHADVRTAVEMMRAGAVTLLEKPFRLEELLDELRRGLALDAEAHADRRKQSDAHDIRAGLTAKESEVLAHISTGKTNKEIAAELGISVRAVEDRRARLMRKVGVRTLADLVRLALPEEP